MQHSVEELYDHFLKSTGVSTDTRHIEEGNIFFALKGPNFNGNRYADMALENGAQLVVVDDPAAAKSAKHFLVQDSLKALQSLARRHRRSFDKPVVGITGSNGKTTTKELLNTVLSTKYKVHYTKGNLNNHIGVPLTLLELNIESVDIAIIEMGANKVGDIAELCDIALPTHGLITNIGNAHIGGFGGKAGIIKGKGELFDFLQDNSGTAFINTSDEVLRNTHHNFSSSFSYPSNENMVEADPYIVFETEGYSYRSMLIGAYNFTNICAALCLGRVFGIDSKAAAEAVCSYSPDNNRSQVIKAGSNKVILDAYNANPDSMAAALSNFNQMKAKKKAVILGEMKELGDYSEEEHRRIGGLLSTIKPDTAFFVGEDMKLAYEQYGAGNYFDSASLLKSYISNMVFEDHLILIKGSRSIGLETVVEAII